MTGELQAGHRGAERPLDADAGAEVVVVRVGAVEFGLPIERVREVVRVPPITRIPFPPPSILGVASVRGTILPVMDLRHRLFGDPGGAAETPETAARLVVVSDPANGEVGLVVDAVPGLARRGEEAQPVPPEVEAALPAGWIEEVIAPDQGRLITLLRLEPVLALSDAPEEER